MKLMFCALGLVKTLVLSHIQAMPVLLRNGASNLVPRFTAALLRKTGIVYSEV